MLIYFLLQFGYWLLVIGYWLLVINQKAALFQENRFQQALGDLNQLHVLTICLF